MGLKYPEYCFVDTAFGNVNKRNNVQNIGKLDIPQERVDCYITYFRFESTYYKHCQDTGSVAGYFGKSYANWLFVDVDDAEDLIKAHNTAKNILLYLETEYEVNLDELEVFFSGKKGFHIALPAAWFNWEPSEDLPQIHKSIAKHMFSGFSIDTAIYEKQRLFRLPNTIHSQTGLYKIKIDARDVLHKSMADIIDMASAPVKIDRTFDVELNPNLNQIYKMYSDKRYYEPKQEAMVRKSTLSDLLSATPEGYRNETCFSIAYDLKQKGLSRDEVQKVVEMWNLTRCQPQMDSEEMRRTINSAFRFQGKTLMEKLSKLKDVQAMEEDYIQYIETIEKNGLNFNGFIPGFGKHLAPVFPGSVIMLNAGTGVGKTTFFSNCIYHWKVPALVVNLERSAAVLYETYQQLSNNMSAKEIRENYKNGVRMDKNHLEHIQVLDDTGINIDDIVEYWQIAQDKIGKRIMVLGVDHSGLLKSKGTTEYERMTYVGNGLIELAKRTDSIVFALNQVSRETAKDGDVPLTVTSAKGSGALENAATLILGIYRPRKMNKRIENGTVTGDDELVVQILKQSYGVEGIQSTVKWDGRTRRVYEETPDMPF